VPAAATHRCDCISPFLLQGVPERATKQLISYARDANKVVIGPATVGGVQVRAEGGCTQTL